jgi:hypothetical protein
MRRMKAGIKDVGANPARMARPSFLTRTNSAGSESVGNQSLLRRLSSTAPRLQFKLTIGAVNDPLEAEADRAADHVMRMSDANISSSGNARTLRRKCAACEDEEKKTVHAKSNGPAVAAGGAPPIVHQVLNSTGRPLDSSTRAFFEPRFGADFSGVRVHSDQAAAQSAGAISAVAYAAGQHIVLGSGASSGPTKLLAHELAHVVQQGGASSGSGHDEGAIGRAIIQRQPGQYPDLNMPAFPCDRGGGVELCNTTKDSVSAPNLGDCMQQSKEIIDSCKGDKSECLPAAKCALCACLGDKYCKCTGIV